MDGRLFFFLVRQRQIIERTIKFFNTRPNGGKEGKRHRRPSLVGGEVYTIVPYSKRNFARSNQKPLYKSGAISSKLPLSIPNSPHLGIPIQRKTLSFFVPAQSVQERFFYVSCFVLIFSIVGLEFAAAKVFHIQKLWFFLPE